MKLLLTLNARPPLTNLPLCQINECEGLQETVSSLKQQLSEALEFRNFNPVTGNSKRYFETHSIQGELPREKENRLSKDTNEGSLLQAQVFFFSPVMSLFVFS